MLKLGYLIRAYTPYADTRVCFQIIRYYSSGIPSLCFPSLSSFLLSFLLLNVMTEYGGPRDGEPQSKSSTAIDPNQLKYLIANRINKDKQQQQKSLLDAPSSVKKHDIEVLYILTAKTRRGREKG